jgi:phosphoribosylformimino-5-aminoimidazole carboxamide ribotide isomerase
VIVFPAIDLFDGRVVKMDPKSGHRTVEKVYGGPAEVAGRWRSAGAEWLHVVDISATLGTGDCNVESLPVLAAAGVSLQWGGGVRDDATLGLVLRAVGRAVVGTKAIRDWEWLARAAEIHPARVVVSIDAKGREVVIGGWQENTGIDVTEFLKRAKDLPIFGFLHTNVSVEGQGKGVDWEPVKAIVDASPKPVIFSGGITTLDEVARFKSLGAHGIIVGSALYSGRMDFKEAQAIAR